MKNLLKAKKSWVTQLLAFQLLATFNVHGQDNHTISYTAFIERMGTSQVTKGLLYQVHDSAVVIFLGKNPESVSESELKHQFKTISAAEISRIKLRPSGRVKRNAKKGAVYGALVGVALGGLEAMAYEADPWLEADAKQLLLAGGISGAMSGAIYGAIAGSIKTKIPINGNQHRFSYQIDFLKAHAYNISGKTSTSTH